jgi:heptosyltransferase-2/heptosyltransferase-3
VLGGEDLSEPDVPRGYGELIVSSQRRDALKAWLGSRGFAGSPLILVQVGNKRTMRRGSRTRASNSKYWPERNWAAVLRGLRDLHPDHTILMLGVPQEAPLNEEILRAAAITNAHNVADDLPIGRLMALCDYAVGMVSVDTGPAHIAAAVGCPVVALFGKMPPSWYAPTGATARVASLSGLDRGEPSMLGIAPSDVLTAWPTVVRAP